MNYGTQLSPGYVYTDTYSATYSATYGPPPVAYGTQLIAVPPAWS